MGEVVKAVETARDSTGSGHLEVASIEAVTTISPVCKSSRQTKLTESESAKVGEQRSMESHIDASLAQDESSAQSNVRENLEEKQTLEKSTDNSGSPASQHPEAGNSEDGGSEKKVAELACPDAAQDDAASGRQMSSNGASVHVSREGEILSDISSSISSSELCPITTDETAPPASDSLTQTTDPENCPSVETVPELHKNNSQSSQEGQHNRNTLNGNEHADDVDMNNHQNKSPACSSAQTVPTASSASIQSVPAADKLINIHASTAGANVQSEKMEKTSGSSESIKLASSQSMSSTNASATTIPSTSSSLPIGTSVDPKSSLVSLEERLATCGLPEAVDDADFDNKLKVFTNYRNFGAMYQSKNNFKKAEWAFKNGIKQAVGCETLRSKEQLRAVIGAELEFRLQRAKSLMRLGQQSEAKVECSTVLIIDSSNTEAPSLLSSLS